MLYMFLADGFEETEAIGALDVIRRAKIPVQLVGVTGEYVTGSHGVEIKTDIRADEIDSFEMTGVILPGGMPGTKNLYASEIVCAAVKQCAADGRLLAALCAAPLIFGRLGLLRGKRATCFPGFEEELDGAEVTGELVTTDGNIITARGAGAAMLFGAAICDKLRGGGGKEILAEMQHPEI